MRTVRILALLALAAGWAPPAQAATQDVTLNAATFDPGVVHATAGDTIRWTVATGSHTVEAHNGDDFDFRDLGPGETVSALFGGGTVLYHCAIHASVDDVTGVCNGMCGAITDRTTNPLAPLVTDPADGGTEDQNTVRVRGTAEPQTTAIVREGGVDLGEAVADEQGDWQVDIEFEQGTHTISARAIDVDGRTSPQGPSVTFTVTADQTLPSAEITTPSPSVFTREPLITGTAHDDFWVARVEVQISIAGQLATVVPATGCTGCGTADATWFLRGGISTGVWELRARAFDLAGNASPLSAPVVVVVAPIQ